MRRLTRLLRFTVLAAVFSSVALGAQTGPPPKAHVAPLVEREAAAPGTRIKAALRVTLAEGLHANANKPRDPSLIPVVLTITPPSGVTVDEIVYPEPKDLVQANAPQPLSVYERDFVIGAAFTIDASAAGQITIPGRLRYQACDEKVCYMPVVIPTSWTITVQPGAAAAASADKKILDAVRWGTGEKPPAATPAAPPAAAAAPGPAPRDLAARLERFTTLGTAAGYLDTDDFLTFIRNAETGVVEKGWFEGRGPLAIVIIVLIGGLALNLTPCVLPMIPINLAIIGAGAQAGTRRRGLMLGATYGAAMAFVYGVLGLLVILTAGTFGTINASPWFNLGIAIVFVALALAMFDVFEIDFSRFSSAYQVDSARRGTFLLAFTLGGLAALLAGACVAPVVIQVVLFASDLYASGTTIALMLPFLLGVGMALPWPVAGAGVAALPKPGPWMVRVKQAFGAFILIMAGYYGCLSYELFASRWVDAADVENSVAAKLKEGWYADLEQGLAAAEAEGKPALIDFWATWCKNCLVMDKTTLADPAISAALANYVKIKYQAENPDEPPASEIMKKFNAIGLPTYVIVKMK